MLLSLEGKARVAFHGRPGGVVPTPVEVARILYREYQRQVKSEK